MQVQQRPSVSSVAPATDTSLVTSTSGKAISSKPKRKMVLTRMDTLRGQFSWLVLLCLVATASCLAGFFSATSTAYDNLNDIVNNSAPSILAAQQMAQAIEDADAKAADYQLYARLTLLGNPGSMDVKIMQNVAWQTILKHRREVTDALFIARDNVTYPGEDEAIAAINEKWLAYAGKVDIMKDLLDKGRWEEALAAYKAGRDILVGNLNNVTLDAAGRSPEEVAKLAGWPKFDTVRVYQGIEANVRKLFEINNASLDKARQAGLNSLKGWLVLVSVLSFVLFLVFVTLCLRTTFVMHRIFNFGYLPGLILSLVACGVMIANMAQFQQDFQTITRDSFISMENVASLRLLAADSNADESRFLLLSTSPELSSTNPALTPEVRAAFRTELLQDNFNKKQNLMKEQLQTLFTNVTFKGEFEVLCKISASPNANKSCPNTNFGLASYLRADQAIRENFTQQKLLEAIRINTGASNDTFDQVDGSLQELYKINDTEFKRGTCNSLGYLRYPPTCPSLGYSTGYLSFMRLSLWLVFPLIALFLVGGLYSIWRQI